MNEKLLKEFDNKFIETKKFDDDDGGYWNFKNIHFLDIIKWIDDNFIPKDKDINDNFVTKQKTKN